MRESTFFSKRIGAFAFAVALLCPAPATSGQDMGDPFVVSTIPRVGNLKVDPGLAEIRVTFDRDMDTSETAFTNQGFWWPEAADEAYWVDNRTCVLPVQLEVETKYRIGINSREHNYFRSAEGVAVQPVVLWFKTGSAERSRLEAPRVVSTEPAVGAKDVDPGLTEIRVTFDRDMDMRSYSWTGGGPLFPKIAGNARWIDKRTCTLPVNLEPGKPYRVGINEPSFRNFRSAADVPAVITEIRFWTAEKGTAGTTGTLAASEAQSRSNEESLDAVARLLRDYYSYYERMDVDWDSLFKKERERIVAARTNLEWTTRVGAMLSAAEDLHLWLQCERESVATHRRAVDPNYRWESAKQAIPNLAGKNETVAAGKTDDGIEYISIETWSREREEDLKEVHRILEDSKTTRGLILDVRMNAGGDELLAREVAAWFVEKPSVYARNVYRDPTAPDGWTKVLDRAIEPNPPARRYKRPVVVLMGPVNMSSCEAFLLMMKQAPRATLVGSKSYGSSGNPKAFTLPNGVTLYIPSWKALHPNGSCFEGYGIRANVFVHFPTDGSYPGDPVLEKALEILRSPED